MYACKLGIELEQGDIIVSPTSYGCEYLAVDIPTEASMYDHTGQWSIEVSPVKYNNEGDWIPDGNQYSLDIGSGMQPFIVISA